MKVKNKHIKKLYVFKLLLINGNNVNKNGNKNQIIKINQRIIAHTTNKNTDEKISSKKYHSDKIKYK